MGFINPPPSSAEPRAGRTLPWHISTRLPAPNTLLLTGTPDLREPPRGLGALGPHHGLPHSAPGRVSSPWAQPHPHTELDPKSTHFPLHWEPPQAQNCQWEGWAWRALGILSPSSPGIRKARGGSLLILPQAALPAGAWLPPSPQPSRAPRLAKAHPSSREQPHGHSERVQGFIDIPPPGASSTAPGSGGQLVPAAVPGGPDRLRGAGGAPGARLGQCRGSAGNSASSSESRSAERSWGRTGGG